RQAQEHPLPARREQRLEVAVEAAQLRAERLAREARATRLARLVQDRLPVCVVLEAEGWGAEVEAQLERSAADLRHDARAFGLTLGRGREHLLRRAREERVVVQRREGDRLARDAREALEALE